MQPLKPITGFIYRAPRKLDQVSLAMSLATLKHLHFQQFLFDAHSGSLRFLQPNDALLAVFVLQHQLYWQRVRTPGNTYC